MYLYTTRQMCSISVAVSFALSMMQYCLAWSIVFLHSANLISHNFACASGVRYSCLPNVFVDVRTIILWTSSPGAASWSKTKGLFAFGVDAIVRFNASISSCIIAFLLPFLAICCPDFFGVVNISIKCLKRFYNGGSCCHLMMFDSAPVLPDQDTGSGSLIYVSPPGTYSDQPRKKKAKRVRFLDDSVVTGFRYKFRYAPLKDRNIQCKDRGCTTWYMVSLWQERIRESSDSKCTEGRDS